MGVQFKIILKKDSIAPALEAAHRSLSEAITQSTYILKQKAHTKIREKWITERPNWAPYTPYKTPKMIHGTPAMHWGQEKALRGFPLMMLVYKGALEKDVAMLEREGIRVERTKDRIVVNLDLRKAFPNSPYLIYHEKASGEQGQRITPGVKIPRRGFVREAMEEFATDVEGSFAGVFLPEKDILAGRYKVPEQSWLGRGMIPEPVFWVIPAGKIFKYVGQTADFRGLLHGWFLDPKIVGIWTGRTLQGRLLITRKVVRRKFRARIYG